MSIAATRERIQDLWDARLVEFYGCTEASPHVGGFSCPAFAAARRSGLHASPRGRAGLGDGRSADAKAAARGRARPHRLHQPQFRILAAAALPRRRLRDLRPRALRLRPHSRARRRLLRRTRRRSHQSARHQDVSGADRACRALDRRHRRRVRDRARHQCRRPRRHDGAGRASIAGDEVAARRGRGDPHALRGARRRSRCWRPGTLPRTEFKAARVKDRRGKS